MLGLNILYVTYEKVSDPYVFFFSDGTIITEFGLFWKGETEIYV